MKQAALVMVGVILAGPAITQDLPPGVLLLSRVKAHVRDELQRLTTISCVETVEREHQPPKGKLQPLDTIRLEVLTNGEKELFASPGDRKFSENHPMSYAGSGTLGNGLFGPYLKDIFVSEIVASEYKGEGQEGGRVLARYEYRIPLLFSVQTIHTLEGSGTVSLHGSYWVDPRNYDVVRLELNAGDFPPSLPVTEMKTVITYARTVLNDRLEVLLPDTADVRLVKQSGEVSHNRVGFTHCRIFGAESQIDFNEPDAPEQPPRFGAATVDETLRPLPAGLAIAVKLSSQISPDTAVGTLIEGVVDGSVTVKRDVVVPAGSRVRGRIRRLERYTDPFPYFVVGLEFTEVEVQGIRCLFYADLVSIEPVPGVERFLTTRETTTETTRAFGGGSTGLYRERLFLYDLPGVATFFLKGGRLELPRGFRTEWKTRPLKP
jgi:hypothetical protein